MVEKAKLRTALERHTKNIVIWFETFGGEGSRELGPLPAPGSEHDEYVLYIGGALVPAPLASFPRISAWSSTNPHLATGPMRLDTPSLLEEAHQVVWVKQKWIAQLALLNIRISSHRWDAVDHIASSRTIQCLRQPILSNSRARPPVAS
jgi:hypothetical protein